MDTTFTLTELLPVLPNSTGFEMTLGPQTMQEVKSFLRCNPDYDGYVFVPKGNGKVKTGAFITENELANRRLINEPSMVIYFQRVSGKFFTIADNRAVVAKEPVEEAPIETIGYLNVQEPNEEVTV